VLGTEALGEVRYVAAGDFVEAEQRAVVTGVKLVRINARTRAASTMPSGWQWVVSTWLDSTKVVETAVTGALTDLAIPIGVATGTHRLAVRLEVVGSGDPRNVEVPAVLIDSVADDSTTVGLALINRRPAPNAVGVPVNQTIAFDVVDVDAVATTLTAVYVAGVLAWDGSFEPGWSGSVAPILGGTGARVSVTSPTNFGSLQEVVVRVLATSASGDLDASYSFRAADVAGPVALNATATDRNVVLVTFDEPALVDAGGSSIEYIQLDETVPAVPLEVAGAPDTRSVSVALTLDREMTPGVVYEATVEATDDAGNTNTSTIRFAGFECAQPERRRFTLLEMLPAMNVAEDVWPFDLRRFVGSLQEIVDWLLCDIDRFDRLFDPDTAPEEFVDAMLVDLGNPFPFALDLRAKRRLVSLLVSIYKAKGTADGIVNTIRLFLGLEVDITYPGWSSGWDLGVSELGVSSYLGTSDSATRYSYRIVAPTILTAEQRSIVRQIAEYMQPAHEHLIEIVEPAPPAAIPDHWELGLSELGITTILH
jgi:phage tail-like protein